ncbi:cytochrome c-type biogenesis protein CcmH [Patulibacter sp. SYSU D01012]|uniref:cytochrome c-type biogenesis protein n=1 Tax=Patulibacter sp. SYSU D01012 TaxID=2817381 RepID=UPI001B304F7C|nr:cytochrome c-type biogenesis protein CcmH [Patulibacter sp. SYSU D01012]
MTARPRRTPALLALLLALLLAAPAAAGAATPRTTLQEVEAELMCVTCKTPLNQSDAVQANKERGEIERLIAQGKTKDEVIAGMVDVYGDQVLLNPPEKGLQTARWLLPALGALLALALLTLLVRRWRRRAAAAPAAEAADDDVPALSDEDRRRLDADLARFG